MIWILLCACKSLIGWILHRKKAYTSVKQHIVPTPFILICISTMLSLLKLSGYYYRIKHHVKSLHPTGWKMTSMSVTLPRENDSKHCITLKDVQEQWVIAFGPQRSEFKGPHIHVMSAKASFCQIWLLQLEDLTERSEISWPANPADKAFVTGASWALFGEGLAVGAVRNDQRGLKRGSTGLPEKPIRARPRLLSGSKLTLGKLPLKAKVYNT